MRLSEITFNSTRKDATNRYDFDDFLGHAEPTGKRIGEYELWWGEYGTLGALLIKSNDDEGFLGALYLIKHDDEQFPHTEIMFDPEIQGKKLALPMYLYVIQEMGFSIMSDSSQTAGGAAIWKKLAEMPGVNVYIYHTSDHTYHGEYDPKDSGRVYGPEDWRHKIRLVATTDSVVSVDESLNESIFMPDMYDSYFKYNNFETTEYAGMKLTYGFGDDVFQIYAYSMSEQPMGAVLFRYDEEYRAYVADDVNVDERFRRQGVATAMYDFAKQTLNTPIRRSNDQTEKGKAFWGDKEIWEAIADEVRERDFYKADYVNTKAGELRVVAKNITDQYPEQFVVEAFTHGGLRVAYARFVAIGPKEETTQTFLGRFKKKVEPVEFPHLVVGNVTVNQEYRRKGIASAIYNWVRSWGNDIEPSPVQTTAGKAFWKAGAGTKMTENSATPDDIFYMISDIHTGHNDIETDEEFQQWVGSFDKYELKDIPLSKLKVSQSNINADKAKSYIKQKNAPPIVVDGTNYWIIDGHHRVAAALARGDKTIKGYVGINELDENFADGKKKGKSRPGRVKRAGASCQGSVSHLRQMAKKYDGERGRMYHWCANMKGGKKKK